MRYILCLVLMAACAGSGTVTYRATATVVEPDLVYVSPGVQVIADYHEPVFYTDGYYWRYIGGTWYRSHTYTAGWRYAPAPRALLRIEQPRAYVRYRPPGYVSRRQPANRPVVRDHRTPAPQRDVRRDDRRDWKHDLRDRDDARHERRDERRGDRRDQREQRRDDRGDRRDDRRDWKDDLRDRRR